MKKPATTREKLYMSCVKNLACCVCHAPPPSEVHHLVNGYRLGHMFTIPLWASCHRGEDGFSGKNRDAWDKSLSNQLKLLKQTCKYLGVKPPEYKSKIVNRNFREEV